MFALNFNTVAAVSRELDICALRHEVYSSNVANADVQGYKRLEVASIREAARSTDLLTGMNAAPLQIGHVTSTHEAVKLDQELAKLSKNALRYEALLTAYEKTSGIMNLAIHEGRGG